MLDQKCIYRKSIFAKCTRLDFDSRTKFFFHKKCLVRFSVHQHFTTMPTFSSSDHICLSGNWARVTSLLVTISIRSQSVYSLETWDQVKTSMNFLENTWWKFGKYLSTRRRTAINGNSSASRGILASASLSNPG